MSTRPIMATNREHGIVAAARALALALLLSPATVRATVAFTVDQPPATSPFANGVTSNGVPSSLTFRITNTGTEPLHRIDIKLPNSAFQLNTATAPSGWGVSIIKSDTTARFTISCQAAGLTSGSSLLFTIGVSSLDGYLTQDATNTAQVTGQGQNGCTTSAAPIVNATVAVKVLYLTGTATPANLLSPSATATVTWTVTNESGAILYNVGVVPVVSPASGASGTCSSLAQMALHATAVITCTYSFTAPGTYTFAANAIDGAGTATALGASAGTVGVGSASATWTRYVVAQGRAPYSLALTISNASAATVSRVDVLNASSSGWSLSSGSATNGLSYGGGTAADVVFSGPLAAGASSTLGITFSAVPAVTAPTQYMFSVVLTPGDGAAYAVSSTQIVVVVVPVLDVAGLTIRSDSTGQVLGWSNTSVPAHDGVVVFRAPAGTVPATPVDFAVYTSGSGGVVYADAGGSTVATFTDGNVGNYNYRVCNHDQYYVYSSCSSGFWNGAGWLDSGVAPTGGWVHALAGDARVRAGFLAGSRIAQASNGPSVTILATSSGARSFAPAAIPSLPSVYTPAANLANGKTALFAADQAGNITAIDMSTGGVYWQVNKPGESFTAGVSGITRAYASAAFRAAYPMDVLLLGSTSGTVYAIDTTSGATLWTLSAGAPVYALINYDALTDLFWVPTAGAGVKAFTMAGSSPTVAAAPAPSWTSPDSTGSYRFNCVRTLGTATITCINTGGVVWFMDKATGALKSPTYATGVSSPTALVRVSGKAATNGLVVSSATRVQVLAVDDTTYAVTPLGTWIPSGVRISTPAVYGDSGFVVAGGNDRRLHRVSLANAAELSQSPQVSTQAVGLSLAQPVFDGASGRYLFGTSDGHLWAIPIF